MREFLDDLWNVFCGMVLIVAFVGAFTVVKWAVDGFPKFWQ